ncbi:uncharacterized protein [Typha latifolia]|uniref:uncharacterized protein isoform X1 n=1 Tax=Typha latifolia TaxID=4733 RepID=UPI003C2EEE4D
MAGSDPSFLRSVELRLLRCTISQTPSSPPSSPKPSPSHPSNSLRPLIESLLISIERGEYGDVLASDAALLPFPFASSWDFKNSTDSAALFYAEAERSIDSFLLSCAAEAWLQVLDAESEEMDDELECKCALLMCLGVAAFLAFTQRNLTGPTGEFSPFPIPAAKKKEDDNGEGEWDVWARRSLASVGCDVQGKFSLLQYIVYAKILLSKLKDLSTKGKNTCLSGKGSVSWWLCRIILLQQRILEELSSSLYELVQVLKKDTLLQFGELEKVSSYWGSLLYEGEGLTIVSVAQLEAGIAEYKYGRVDSSRMHLKFAEEACGLQLSLTGILGFRTIHQVDAKPQLVLVAKADKQVNHDGSPIETSPTQHDASSFEDKEISSPHAQNNSSDILRIPRLLHSEMMSDVNENSTGSSSNLLLSAIQQTVVLAQCLHLRRRSRDDELSRWEMGPYIESIDAQSHSLYSIRSFCDILRIRWESGRSHTKERALLMMDNLVEIVNKALPVAAQRIQFAFGVYMPTVPALRKEYSELLVSCGMIGEALHIFEDLELWDNLIYCYQLLDKKAAAVDLIKARLSETPNDPRLWCSLGDVTTTDAHYEKALEVSNNKSSRALRSLARSSYNRGDYETSKTLWESALALNSLYPDGWFALGAAALKSRDVEKAVDAFTHAVQIDPDNGEAWNNIACLHMIRKKNTAAFIAFKEALKFRRNSWQLWENFSHVSLDVGNLHQALEATKMVLDLSSNKRVDVELLDKLMRKFEERSSTPALTSFDIHQTSVANSLSDTSNESGHPESVLEAPREYSSLLEMLGNVLQQVIRNGGSGDIWGLYARWHKIKGDLTMCSEALLKQVRSLQGSDMWHDSNKFKRFAHASFQLCKIYMEIASSTGNRRELITAEMHLRSSVKQAVNFQETEEFRALDSCLSEVRKLLAATSSDGA